ncbi:putative exosomal 3'-5' exoribonuclease complex subunit [Toxoplasma gondii VAND]|uniref:Putative exosomal 3'-5' exoribonuclease complex subunit n=1 Tax=Toxoplasma gondii VAND TaxID=933077 RepID=A0A086QAL2_TOXGO|nr:putative exosomal 3'-5' exoribonuclease complex subunit [Toxoplasma gondii VAND]
MLFIVVESVSQQRRRSTKLRTQEHQFSFGVSLLFLPCLPSPFKRLFSRPVDSFPIAKANSLVNRHGKERIISSSLRQSLQLFSSLSSCLLLIRYRPSSEPPCCFSCFLSLLFVLASLPFSCLGRFSLPPLCLSPSVSLALAVLLDLSLTLLISRTSPPDFPSSSALPVCPPGVCLSVSFFRFLMAPTPAGASSGPSSPAVFLPGDMLLRIVPSASPSESRRAIERLSQVEEQFDFSSPVAAAARCASAGSRELTASAPCAFVESSPLYPYSPSYIRGSQKRYEPVEGDVVVGIVSGKKNEAYTVNIRARGDGSLPLVSSFEGATRRHKPELRRGSLILCRVERASPELGAELTCIDPNCKKSWTSQEKLLGELEGGFVLDVPAPLAISLSSPHCFLLESLGERLAFEIASGANGRVWIRAKDAGDAILIGNILVACYGKERHVMQAIINTLVSKRQES